MTLGALQFGNSASTSTGYTLSGQGSNSLTFNNSGNGATISVANGTHAVSAPVILADNLAVMSAGTNPWTLSFGTASSIVQSGTGSYSLTMNGAGGTLILGGSNGYEGGTQINAGILNINSDAALGDAAGTLTFTGTGTLQAGADGIVLKASRNVNLNSGAIATVDTQANNMTIAGSISGSGSLAKTGSGTLIITNANNSFGGVDSSGNPFGIVSIHQGGILVSPRGVLTNNTSEIDVGDTAEQTGTLAISGGTAIVPLGNTGYSGVNVGIHGGTGILTLTLNSLLDATATNQNNNPPSRIPILLLVQRHRHRPFARLCRHSHRRWHLHIEGQQRAFQQHRANHRGGWRRRHAHDSRPGPGGDP